MSRFRPLAALFGWLVLAAAPVAAQAGGTLAGRVVDDTGAALPGVTVEVRGGTLPAPRVASTDGDGGFRFDDVPAGTYRVTYQLLGFAGVAREAVAVAAGAEATADATLRLSVTADVLVSGAARSATSPTSRTLRRTSSASRRRPAKAPSRPRRSSASDHARRRSARDRAGPRRHAAQRRRQGEPVLPARLQPRPRHRLRDDRRRRAGQHADARARPGLHGPQLPDPRAGRAASQYKKGPYFAEEGDFSAAGAANINYVNAARATDRRAWQRRHDGYRAALAGRTRRSVGGGHLLCARRGACTTTAPGRGPTTIARSTACCATARGDTRNGFVADGHGLPRRTGTRPTRFRSAPSTAG